MSTTIVDGLVGGGLVQVVRSAAEVGLLDALDAPATAAEVATRLGLAERAVSLTLGVLLAVRFVERVGDAYRIPPTTQVNLEELPRLTSFLRTGDVPPCLDRPERRAAYYADGVESMGAALQGSARSLARELPAARRVADVGAGSAVWGLAMVEASGGQVVAIDHPDVLPNARRMARALGLEDRLIERPGDYFHVREEGVDRVVLANVLHLEAAADAERLIRHHAGGLAADGELVIVDVFGGEGRDARLFEAVYQLHLGMRTRRGRAHDLGQLAGWCAGAGLPVQRVVRLDDAVGALVCRRG